MNKTLASNSIVVAATRVLGGRTLGVIEYYLRPGVRKGAGGPFNGQLFRQAIFREIVRRVDFRAIVETGTFRGTTTAFLAESAPVPIYSAEVHPRFFGYCSARFFGDERVHIFHGDSRRFLQKLALRQELSGSRLFFYLDAHWGDDLPLDGEVATIFDVWPTSVVMVDDFKVPNDGGYGFDDYGQSKTLDLDYLRRANDARDLEAFFPAARSDAETGARRGSVVLAVDPDTISALAKIEALRRHSAQRCAS